MPMSDRDTGRASPPDAATAMPPAASEPLVAIRGLTKYYVRGEQLIPVLVGIDLDVAPGRLRCADGAVGIGQVHAAQS